MNITKYIDDFVKNVKLRMPIYTDDIYAYVKLNLPNVSKATFNMTLQRYQKNNPDFIRYRKGIYYKSMHTPFGDSGIDVVELIKRKYLETHDEIIGYESGPSYMNKIGLTTQMPNMTYIVTSKARYAKKDKEVGICLLKPVIRVSNDNYRYLQLLDMLENKMNVNIEAQNYREILRKQIISYNLNFEKLIGYAKYYDSVKVYKGLSELARGV